MLKQEGKTQYRFYRPRRPGGMGEGLRLEGMSSLFGLMGIGLLIFVGGFMLVVSNIPTEKDMTAVDIELTAPPYRSPRNGVLLPITRARVMALSQASFAAADSAKLFSLVKGDVLKAWLKAPEAQKWNEGVGRKDFYHTLLLQKKNGDWLVDYKSYRRKAGKFSSQGWWIILFGLMLIPYQLIRKPQIPVWAAIGGFILVIILWNFLL